MQRFFFLALGVSVLTSQGPSQSIQPSIQGVWRVVEATITGPGARTIAFAVSNHAHLFQPGAADDL